MTRSNTWEKRSKEMYLMLIRPNLHNASPKIMNIKPLNIYQYYYKYAQHSFYFWMIKYLRNHLCDCETFSAFKAYFWKYSDLLICPSHFGAMNRRPFSNPIIFHWADVHLVPFNIYRALYGCKSCYINWYSSQWNQLSPSIYK